MLNHLSRRVTGVSGEALRRLGPQEQSARSTGQLAVERLGRAPGTDGATAAALRSGTNANDDFPQQVLELLGFAVEVLSDATGAIDLTNEAGSVSTRQVHETLMPLLHSDLAADTDTWSLALQTGNPLNRGDLVTSAAQGRDAH